MKTKVSVLICTFDRPHLLEGSLSALLRSNELPDEVIVVNGGNEDADVVVRSYESQFACIKLVKTKNINLAASRNVGLPHCTGDIVAMTDDDTQVFPDWVSRMKQVHHEHPEAGAIGGMVIGLNHDKLIGRIADLATFPSFADTRYVRTLPGANISYKKKIIDQIGPQDERLFRGEDVDWNWRVRRLGYEIYYDPTIKVYHYHRPTLRQFFYQHYMYGRAYYLVRNKWKEMYCVYPHGIKETKDLIKIGNFLACILYEPLLASVKMEKLSDRLLSCPVLMANQFVWKWGMVRQAMLTQQHCSEKPI